ncbi:MAG: hypothetical protein V4510_00140 [bacterium]
MPGKSREEKFLQQAAKGTGFWRRSRFLALGLAGLLTAGALFELWRAWTVPAHDAMTDVLGLFSLLGIGIAAGMWHVHAEMMEGAAAFLEREAASASKP